MAKLDARLRALEARPAKVDPEKAERFRAAVAALLDVFSLRTNWQDLLEQPSDLEALCARLRAGTATDADRAALASLPACHLKPEQLVEAVAAVDAPQPPGHRGYRGDTKWQS